MLHQVLALTAALCLAACDTAAPQSGGQYRVVAYDAMVPLAFSQGGATLLPADRRTLGRLSLELPAALVPDVYATGPLAPARVGAIGAALQRPARWIQDGGADPDRVLMVLRSPASIVTDACRGPGVHLPGGPWPGSDAATAVILPPGCAVATSIQAQVTSPSDLIQGRALPPGAALPYAAAIERYYHRNDQAQPAPTPGSSSAGDTGAASSASASADPARSAALQNPLLGPLPTQAATPR